MAKIRIYNDIVDEEEKVFMQWCDMDGVCFKDIKDIIERIPADDNTIDISLHCRGGQCIEGWAIYDALRASGKEITATVDGECSSMATIILLAAPRERRFAQPNASMCIHNPYVPYVDLWSAETLTADELDKLAAKVRAQATALREEQQKILDLYVERTCADKGTLQALMAEDKYIGMDRAKELGFIGDILAPNTDIKVKSKTRKSMNKDKVEVEASVFVRMLQKLGLKKVEDFKVVDMVITAADGQELTIERDEGDPEVGDAASPDGTFTMDDGSTIVVVDGLITEINKADDTDRDDGTDKDKDKDNGEDGGDGGGDGAADCQNGAGVRDVLAKMTALEAEMKALRQQQADNKAVADKVRALGGAQWLDAAAKARSAFTPANTRFQERGAKQETQALGNDFLAAKRAARKHK